MLLPLIQNPTKQILSKNAPQWQRITTIGEQYKKLKDDQLQLKTQDLKSRLLNGQSQADIIDEAFALVREATTRVLTIRHYDVQWLGGLVLNEGNIAEMKTGDGKNIVALFATCLQACSGKVTHVVTVNEYVAGRGADTVVHGYRV